MDYQTLTSPKTVPGSIASWANDSRIQGDASFIVDEAQAYIYRSLRHWRMLSVPIAGNMVVGNDYIAIPSDFLEPFILVYTGIYAGEISQRTPEEIVRAWAYDGNGARIQQQPRIYSFNGTNIVFDQQPDMTYAIAYLYFQQPTALSALTSPGVNWLTTFYPRLLRCACMIGVAEWEKDYGPGGPSDTRIYWDQRAQEELMKAQAESDRARRGVQFSAEIIGGGPRDIFPTYS